MKRSTLLREKSHTLLEMAEYVGTAVGKEPRVIAARPLAGEITRYVANLGKAETLVVF